MSEEISYTMISLGCPKNRVDTEKIMFVMREANYVFTDDLSEAKVIIINTCAFIESAVEESINTILDYATENSEAFFVVAGCLPLRYGEDARESLPEVDLFLEPKRISDLPKLLNESLKIGPRSRNDKFLKHVNHGSGRILTTPGYAYLRVSDGCDRSCAYCAIPMIRGRMKSEPIEKLENEARELAEKGARELILVAQDLCSYGTDLHIRGGLEKLLERLNGIDSVSWLRLMYLHPNGFPKGLLDVMGTQQKVLPYLDIPIQHISSRVLKDMKRPWRADTIKGLFETIRNTIPGVALRTTVMVGYPTETERDFMELVDFLDYAQIDRVGVFAYSPEEGTDAFELGDRVPSEEKQARVDEIIKVHSEFAQKKNESRIGQIDKAIVEGYSPDTDLLLAGRLWDQAPEIDGNLFITDGLAVSGGIYSVRINEVNGTDFFGEIVG